MFKKERGYAARSNNSKVLWQWRGWPYLSIQKILVSKNGNNDLKLLGIKFYGLGVYFRWNTAS